MEAGAGDDTGKCSHSRLSDRRDRQPQVGGSRDAELHNPTPRLFYNREISEIVQVAFISKTMEAANYRTAFILYYPSVYFSCKAAYVFIWFPFLTVFLPNMGVSFPL